MAVMLRLLHAIRGNLAQANPTARRASSDTGPIANGPQAQYDKWTADWPGEAPYTAASAEWVCSALGRFDAQRLKGAVAEAREVPFDSLCGPLALGTWLDALWDAVSRELDCSSLPVEQQADLRRLETYLAHSVHALRLATDK